MLAAFHRYAGDFECYAQLHALMQVRFLNRWVYPMAIACKFPRDALVADSTDASNRGAAYGLRQSLDTIGAFLGPLIALRFLSAGQIFRFIIQLLACHNPYGRLLVQPTGWKSQRRCWCAGLDLLGYAA